MDNNEMLFNKASNGDIGAFEQFIAGYEKMIYNACYRMLPNPYDAQDMSQEVLIKIYHSLSTCKSAKAFKCWLFRIIHNTCIDEIRKRKGKQAYSLDEQLESDDGPMENQILKDEQTPEDVLMNKETAEEIQKAISMLSPDYRMIIVLRDINGLSYDEIAEILDINLGTVKSRISRARSNLQKALKKNREQSL